MLDYCREIIFFNCHRSQYKKSKLYSLMSCSNHSTASTQIFQKFPCKLCWHNLRGAYKMGSYMFSPLKSITNILTQKLKKIISCAWVY